jgi:Domain of unknown function (DUF4760)
MVRRLATALLIVTLSLGCSAIARAEEASPAKAEPSLALAESSQAVAKVDESELARATWYLVVATAILGFATLALVGVTWVLAKATKEDFRRRTQLETMERLDEVRRQINIPNRSELVAMVDAWKVGGGSAKKRNELRRSLRPLEFLAAAVNSGTLSYDMTKRLSGTVLVGYYEKLSGFIRQAQEQKNHQDDWSEIVLLCEKIKTDVQNKSDGDEDE